MIIAVSFCAAISRLIVISPQSGASHTCCGFRCFNAPPTRRDVRAFARLFYGRAQQAEIDRSFPITVFDTVLLGRWARIGGFGSAQASDLHDAEHAIEAVGLRGAADLMPSELSGGMARRVALARAVALDPQLMLYALGALDAYSYVGDFEEICMVIHQPRLNVVSEFWVKVDEMEAFRETVKAAAQAFPSWMKVAPRDRGRMLQKIADALEARVEEMARILAEETGVTHVIDPLGGSYYVESLTHSLAAAAWELIEEVEALGLKVHAQYALMGQYDFLNIIEAPDERTMARAAVALAARGTMRTTTMQEYCGLSAGK